MKICRDCETKYDKEEFCPECGGDELWNPDVDDPDWFKPDFNSNLGSLPSLPPIIFTVRT